MDEAHLYFGKSLTLMHDDSLLIQQLKTKNERALSSLYDKYSEALYFVILKMTKDETAAQDLLMKTFMTIWEKSHQYDSDKGRFYTWAYRIARNKTLNFLRKSDPFIQTDDFSVYESTEDNITKNDDSLALRGAILKLEKHHQKALELIYFKGLTHREAYKEMDVPLGTFKSYVRQALRELKTIYSKTMVFVLTFGKGL
ncbi:RNA polymerase sigma factor [Winogradskyella sp. A3E31]|uniref:RNA polymerase sigma factor n=1 Tax=Winogradskyella sp. A3E31 TaxID=3349637 RepID=UPI00398B9B7D